MLKDLIRYWLYSVICLCLLIVMVGGATRLTGSGLSITQWQPINGIIPPLNHVSWEAEFTKYKQIAQFQQLNATINLAEFKNLYWWEWSHRLLARIIGVLALLPLFVCGIYFVKGKRRVPYLPYFFILPILVAIQGIIGWWMVYSGLNGSTLTSVSQYRLAIHMVCASSIIMFTTYLVGNFIDYKEKAAPKIIQKIATIFSFFILMQLYFGALVAGSHAGFSYNTWPLLDNQIIPTNLWLLKPWWHNLFENILTIQFIHRSFAYIIFLLALFNVILCLKLTKNSAHFVRSIILFVMICSQILFGILTLIWRVPIAMGLLHQFFALLLLVFSVLNWRATKT